VILPDINLLLYAHHAEMPEHAAARKWWEGLLNSDVRIAVPWIVTLGFLRISTNSRVFQKAPSAEAVSAAIRGWFVRPNVQPLEPGPHHYETMHRLILELGVAGPLTTDIHLVALALENRCELHSNDRDFSRFKGLKWVNPLEK
jgi:uncharacterized protein